MKIFAFSFIAVSMLFLSVFGVNCFYGYLFPTKFKEEVASASTSFGVDRAVIYSVINVESGFQKDAVSRKGAIGLMQLMPDTANEIAQKLDIKSFDLKNPQDNITLGTFYFSTLKKRFKDEKTALCAYNAGPSNVSLWLLNKKYSDDGKTLKNIPFKETREYIEKINKNLKYYSKK